MLRDFSQDRGLQEVDTVSAEDQMDDGSKIKLAVTINRKEGSAIFNFEGAPLLSISCSKASSLFARQLFSLAAAFS